MSTAPLRNLLPPLEPEQYEALKESIATHGFWPSSPILVDKHGNIVDGWNRQQIADELGIEAPRVVVEGDPTAYELAVRAITANTHRRHFTPAMRRQVLGTLKRMYDEELRRQGKANQAAAGRATAADRACPTETRQDRARVGAADATVTRFDEPVVANPAIVKADRIATLGQALGVSRSTINRDERRLDRMEVIEKEAQRQHRDDVIRQLDKPRANLDLLEMAVGLRERPVEEAEDDTALRLGWVATLAKCIDKLPPPHSADEADALLAAVSDPDMLTTALAEIIKAVTKRG